MRLRDYLQWQDSTDLDAFITRLDDTEERVRQNLRTFVVGAGVFEQLDRLLGELGRRLADNRDIGRYIYGNFGSGKSHLMTVLGKMLERDEAVYDLGHPALRRLRANHPWLDTGRVLVVRINMMGKRSLTTALYDAFNAALPADVPKLSFTDEERIFRLIDLDAERLGGLDALVERLVADAARTPIEGLPSVPAPMLKDWILRNRQTTDLDKRLQLAASLQTWRDQGAEPIRPDDLWLDAKPGLDRIARHASEHGFTAIAWLIDELVMWIRGKTRAEYIQQLNNLSAMVDHDAARPLAFFVAAAVQQDISRTCPEDLSESDFQAQFGFIKDRFDPRIQLEDQDLYEVAAERVLARRPDLTVEQRAAFDGAINDLFQKNREAISALSGGLQPELVRRLYPFHPALLRILVDVTQALSRNRTAVAALYVLLNRYGDLTPGKFIPVGALWEFVFTPENVSSMRQNTSSRLAQRVADAHATMERLDGKIEAVARDASADPNMLRQLVRTVLLCQLSDRPYSDGRALRERVTASTLLRLNQTEVTVVHERTGVTRVVSLFKKLNGVAPNVEVTGPDIDPIIYVKTEPVDIEKVLAIARTDVGHPHRFAYMRKLISEQLGLGLKDGNEAAVEVLWRGTKRKGKVRLANVRRLSYAGQINDFDPGNAEFLLLVDYPFDEESGFGRQDDVDHVERARARSTHWTLSWLPQHLSEAEMAALDNAAAVELVRKDERRYFEAIPPREADTIRRALEVFQAGRKGELEEAIRRIYFEQGKVEHSKNALSGLNLQGVDRGRAIDAFASFVLDKRFPNHPDFRRKLSTADLASVAEWVIRAAKTGKPWDLKAADMALVEAIAVPLELVHKGAGTITPRLDGRYLGPIRRWIGARRTFEASELRELMMSEWDSSRSRDENNWGFGFSKDVSNLWLLYLLQVEGFEAQINEKSTTIAGLAELPERFRLVKDEVVDAPTWDKARKVAERLVDVRGRSDLPTSPEQAKLVKDASAEAGKLTQAARLFQTRFGEVAKWADVDTTRSARLSAVGDLVVYLDGLRAETSNAAQCRWLARAADPQSTGTPAPIEGYERIRRQLSEETAALSSLASQKVPFEHVRRAGDEADRTAVVVRLQNLLLDGWEAGRLHDAVPKWIKETTTRFEALLKKDKPGETEEARIAREKREREERAEAERRAVESERLRRQEEEARKAATAEAQAAEARRREAEARAKEAEEQLRRAREAAEERRSQERTCEGTREGVAAAVQHELAQALAVTSGKRVRVRIIVESME